LISVSEAAFTALTECQKGVWPACERFAPAVPKLRFSLGFLLTAWKVAD